jgi:hypothetical protein
MDGEIVITTSMGEVGSYYAKENCIPNSLLSWMLKQPLICHEECE